MTNKALIRRLQISCLGLDPVDPLRLLVDDVIEALRENAMREVQRLGQEIEQEPCDMGEMCLGCSPRRADGSCPDAKPWVGLTDEEYDEIWRMDLNNKDIMDMTISKLKERNT